VQGKEKSRRNAITHGIFAVGIIPERESMAEYLGAVRGMYEALQPVGALEEILAEKLAMLVWRYRRVLQAEAAQVAKQTRESRSSYRIDKGLELSRSVTEEGLIRVAIDYYDADALSAAIASLRKLSWDIRERGLDWERDRRVLLQVYGPQRAPLEEGPRSVQRDHRGISIYEGPDPSCMVARLYTDFVWPGTGSSAATEFQPDFVLPIHGILAEEIFRLESMLEHWRQLGDDRTRGEESIELVPREDRFMRYEVSLDRAFDRTLSQLERLQRIRSGQAVPPALKVDISTCG
jgi:hypothetical protein